MSAIGRRCVRRAMDGFTLLELLVVIAIMGLIAGLMFPRIDRMLDVSRFASSRTSVAAAAQAARAEAMRLDTIVRLEVAGDGRSLLDNGRTVAAVPEPIHIASVSGGARFFADGTSSGGMFQLSAPRLGALLQISAPTGTIRWRQ